MQETMGRGALAARLTLGRRGLRRWRERGALAASRRASILAVVLSACGPSSDADAPWEPSALDERVQYSAGAPRNAYTLFEADPVRPIAVLERSGVVAVTNTADNYLELFQPTRRAVRHCSAVQVGLQPVAVAVVRESRSAAELWVVNHLSDSISVVDLDPRDCSAEVIRTLDVGDEPRDIVVTRNFEGGTRVFVATAHRGQHHPVPGARLGTDLITPAGEKESAGLADVLVFDPEVPAEPPRVVNLFSDKPRALAAGDGVVYAASYFSGNRTTVIPAETVTLRGLESLRSMLALDVEGAPMEQGDELLLAPGAAGSALLEGGLPAVAGRGRCLADPRDEQDDFNLLRLCAETDELNRVQRVHVQREGVVHATCQCTSGDGTLQPRTGVIVQFFADPAACGTAWTTFPDGSQGCWLDAVPGGVRSPARASERQAVPMAWNALVKFSLPDHDVFAIDAGELVVTAAYAGVGTVLFGMAVQPQTGTVFVTNTDAQNLTRFEGHGLSSSTSVIGHLHESRVTLIDPAPGGAVEPVHLNTHIDYGTCCEKDAGENDKSFAFPTSGVFSADGERFFFSALGSDKVGIVSAGALAAGFDHDAARDAGELREIFLGDDVTEPSGPVGLALDGPRERLYVKTHFTSELVVVDARRERITGRVRLPHPEPESVTRGRSILYNARLTSSHGDSACASCHVFGDFDGLAWDLGDPDGVTVTNPGPFALPDTGDADFRSNKGPMTTQTLRGLANHGPMHWRGDRTRRFQDAPGEQPDIGAFDEFNSFGEFDVAVAGLNGNDGLLAPEVFDRFTVFALQLTLPPNPIRHLDNTLTPDQAAARALYFGCASMNDEQYEARRCRGLDGALVEIESATAECLCARNPVVEELRLLPEVRGFAELLHALFGSGDLRSRLEALAHDTTGLPAEVQVEVSAAAVSFTEGNAELLAADLAPDPRSLLSASLAAALSKSSTSLLTVLGASRAHQTDTAERMAAALFQAVPGDVLPPELPRDAGGALTLFETIARVSAFSELARADELARGTSAFRDMLSGCDLRAEHVCNLRVTDTALTCHGCHTLDPRGNAEFGVDEPGFFGTSGAHSFEGESQVFKIPHLRNAYQKTGMFGAAPNPFFLPESVLGPRSGGFFSRDTRYMGPQVRGTGFFHDGVTDTLHRFHGATAFVRSGDNEDGLDAFLPREDQRAACVQRFRQAPSELFELADAELLPFLALCVSSGPLPELCFTEPSAGACQAALAEVGATLGVDGLPEAFAQGVLPLCFQLGSMTEGGSAEGVCYPTGLRERAQMESFMLAFDSNLEPVVGQQLTLESGSVAHPRLAELLTAAARGACDLAVRQRGQGYLVILPDAAAPERSVLVNRGGRRVTLGELAPRRGALTLTCHPPAAEQAEARRAAFAGTERPH